MSDLAASLAELVRDVVREVVREELNAARESLGPAADNAPVYLTVAEAADVVGVHEATVRGWIREGRLTASRIGRVYRVQRSELDRAVNGSEQFASSAIHRRAREILGR